MTCEKFNGAAGIGVGGAVIERNADEEVVHFLTEAWERLLDWGLLNGLLNGNGLVPPTILRNLFLAPFASTVAELAVSCTLAETVGRSGKV